MKISSQPVPQPGGGAYPILRVVADEKPFFATAVVGRFKPEAMTAGDYYDECLRRLIGRQTQASNNEELVVVEIESLESAHGAVIETAADVSRNGAAAFFCPDMKTQQAVLRFLGVAEFG